MNNTHLLRWAKALESGQYSQGKSALLTEDGDYCCLGVGFELCLQDAGVDQEIIEDRISGLGLPGYAFAEWLGLVVDPDGADEHGTDEWRVYIHIRGPLDDEEAAELGLTADQREAVENQRNAVIGLDASEANDSIGLNFRQIAWLIRKFGISEV